MIPSCYFSADDCCPDEEIRIVILGKTGAGKSSTGNTILGKKMFRTGLSPSSITKKCKTARKKRFGQKILLVDTPGMFNTEETDKYIQSEISKCIGDISGTHAFILVLNATNRHTEEEQDSVEHFLKYFGEEICKYLFVVFTRKEELDEQKISLVEHLKHYPPSFRNLITKCDGRVFAFNNKLEDAEQVNQVYELLGMISKNVKNNCIKCYTNKMFPGIEREIREKEAEKIDNPQEELEEKIKHLEKKITQYETSMQLHGHQLSMENQIRERNWELIRRNEQLQRQVSRLDEQLTKLKEEHAQSHKLKGEFF